MTKSKNTKRALLMSVLSMMLCMAMLAGSTFAWFTDSVTSGKNRIVAGNLDVELYYKNASTEDKWKDASEASVANPNFFVDRDGNNILWEPGVMAVTQFKVANVGTLALKYALETLKADFNSLKDEKGEPRNLSEVIKFFVIDGEATFSDRKVTLPSKEEGKENEPVDISTLEFADFESFKKGGHLLPNDEEIFTVVAYWAPNPNDVDNLYNVNNGKGKNLDKKYKDENNNDIDQLYIDIDIRLNATQYTYEEDSFGKDYDKNADVYGLIGSDERVDRLVSVGYAPVGTPDDLADALSEGKKVVLTKDVTVSKLVAAEGTVIDGNGNTITGTANLNLPKNVEYKNVEFALENGWGVITSAAKFTNCTFDEVSPYLIPKENEDIVFDGCTFVDTTLQVCYNEGGQKPETCKTIITNNTFVVNNTDDKAHAIVLGGGSVDFWADGAKTVKIEGNTFTPNNPETPYIAYYIYGDYADPSKPSAEYVQLTSVPVYRNNTFNGNADYYMNWLLDGSGTRYPLNVVIANGLYYDGEDTYYVTNAAGLTAMTNKINEYEEFGYQYPQNHADDKSGFINNKSDPGFLYNKTVKLTGNIDLGGVEWLPIGGFGFTSKQFAGTFDGQGYTVSNFKITKKNIDNEGRNRSSHGLFGNVSGTIKNLTVKDVTVDLKDAADGNPVGALVGRLNGGGSIENCHVVDSNLTTNDWQIGGLVGQNNAGNIKDCSVVNTTVTGQSAVGALVGIRLAAGESTIEKCSVNGCTLVMENASGEYDEEMFGVVLGAVFAADATVNVKACTIESTTIKGTASSVVCGYTESGATVIVTD